MSTGYSEPVVSGSAQTPELRYLRLSLFLFRYSSTRAGRFARVSSRYGVLDGVVLDDGVLDGVETEAGVYRVSDIVEKPDPSEAPSNLAIAGRYVFVPDIFDLLVQTSRARTTRPSSPTPCGPWPETVPSSVSVSKEGGTTSETSSTSSERTSTMP